MLQTRSLSISVVRQAKGPTHISLSNTPTLSTTKQTLLPQAAVVARRLIVNALKMLSRPPVTATSPMSVQVLSQPSNTIQIKWRLISHLASQLNEPPPQRRQLRAGQRHRLPQQSGADSVETVLPVSVPKWRIKSPLDTTTIFLSRIAWLLFRIIHNSHRLPRTVMHER